MLDEKKATGVLHFVKHKELASRIAKLTENIEELRSEKTMILSRFDKVDDEGMKDVKKWVSSMENSLRQLEQTEAKYQAELDMALAQFKELVQQAETMEDTELHRERQSWRPAMATDARSKLQQVYGEKYSPFTMMDAERDVTNLLWEDEKRLAPPVRKQPARNQPESRKKQSNRDYER